MSEQAAAGELVGSEFGLTHFGEVAGCLDE
jgi:hypothetical protein